MAPHLWQVEAVGVSLDLQTGQLGMSAVVNLRGGFTEATEDYGIRFLAWKKFCAVDTENPISLFCSEKLQAISGSIHRKEDLPMRKIWERPEWQDGALP